MRHQLQVERPDYLQFARRIGICHRRRDLCWWMLDCRRTSFRGGPILCSPGDGKWGAGAAGESPPPPPPATYPTLAMQSGVRVAAACAEGIMMRTLCVLSEWESAVLSEMPSGTLLSAACPRGPPLGMDCVSPLGWIFCMDGSLLSPVCAL